jgi:hypothetical protein
METVFDEDDGAEVNKGNSFRRFSSLKGFFSAVAASLCVLVWWNQGYEARAIKFSTLDKSHFWNCGGQYSHDAASQMWKRFRISVRLITPLSYSYEATVRRFTAAGVKLGSSEGVHVTVSTKISSTENQLDRLWCPWLQEKMVYEIKYPSRLVSVSGRSTSTLLNPIAFDISLLNRQVPSRFEALFDARFEQALFESIVRQSAV